MLHLPDNKLHYPICIEKKRNIGKNERIKLDKVYSSLIHKMKKKSFIYVNKANGN